VEVAVRQLAKEADVTRARTSSAENAEGTPETFVLPISHGPSTPSSSPLAKLVNALGFGKRKEQTGDEAGRKGGIVMAAPAPPPAPARYVVNTPAAAAPPAPAPQAETPAAALNPVEEALTTQPRPLRTSVVERLALSPPPVVPGLPEAETGIAAFARRRSIVQTLTSSSTIWEEEAIRAKAVVTDQVAEAPAPVAAPVTPQPRSAGGGSTWYGDAVAPKRRSGATTWSGDVVSNVNSWRAWREPGDNPLTSYLHVKGLFTLPPERCGSRVVLQEAVLSSYHHQQWDNVTGSGGGSPVLILERVIIPPSFDDVNNAGGDEAMVVAVNFRKEENLRPASAMLHNQTQMPAPARYTHVTIIPDGVTLPIAS